MLPMPSGVNPCRASVRGDMRRLGVRDSESDPSCWGDCHAKRHHNAVVTHLEAGRPQLDTRGHQRELGQAACVVHAAECGQGAGRHGRECGIEHLRRCE